MASFDAYGMDGEQIHSDIINHPFQVDDDDSYSNFADNHQFWVHSGDDDVEVDDITPSHLEIFGFGSSDPSHAYSQSPFVTENGNGFGVENDDVFASDGPMLPPPTEMKPEEGFILRGWRRHNAIVLEDKKKKDKETRSQIIEEAEEYKRAFYEKREKAIETNKNKFLYS